MTNSNTLLKLIKFGIGLILFIPLYIGGSFYFPFIFPKIWLFQLVVEIIFFLYVVLALKDGRFRPKYNRVLGAVLLLTLFLIITGLTGVDFFRSFWGNTERMSGIVAWLHFVAFAVILSGVLKTEKEWKKFFGVAVIVSILEFFYVLGQYVNASWVWLPSSRAGTIGNADLLGTYAIFSAFFALYFWSPTLGGLCSAHEDKKIIPQGWGMVWVTAFVMNIGTMFIASSRGAILGFAAGLAVYGIFSVWKNKQARKIWAITIAVLLSAYGALFLARNTDFVKNNDQLTRLANVSLKSDTVQQRFTEWGIAWNAFKARPVFGWGPNNYLYLHNAFLNPRVYELRETNFDRAHNAYLDYASMSGILGLIGYVFLIAILFWVFLKGNVKTMAALVAAYAVQSFFVFDSPASYIALFLTIGHAMHIEENIKFEILNPKQIRNAKYETKNNLNPQTLVVLRVVCFMLCVYVFWQVSVKPASANIKFVRAFNDSALNPEDAFDLYKQAVAQETLGTTEFRNQYVNWLQKILNNFKPEERVAVLDFGIGELEKEVKIHPAVFSYLNLGQLYNYKARGFQDDSIKEEFFKKAAGVYDQALKLSPNRLEVYYSYLQLCFDVKNYAKGVELMKTASSNAPNYWQPRWYLGLAEIAAGNDAAAVEAINKALVIFYNPVNIAMKNGRLEFDYEKSLIFTTSFAPKTEILGAVNPYIRLKMWPELLLLYLSAEKGDPADVGIHQSLALVYQNLGFQDKALEELKIIDSLKK